ncbi:MAG: hypothetical protein ACOYYS_06675 [Chloroflexota bacterium]
MKRIDLPGGKARLAIKWLPLIGVIGLSIFPVRLWVRQCLVLVTMIWSMIALYLE